MLFRKTNFTPYVLDGSEGIVHDVRGDTVDFLSILHFIPDRPAFEGRMIFGKVSHFVYQKCFAHTGLADDYGCAAFFLPEKRGELS